MSTTTPNRIRKWSPTLLLTGRYPGCLRRSDGMRNFLDSMVVDEKGARFEFMNVSRFPPRTGVSQVRYILTGLNGHVWALTSDN